ncbi:coil containing protein [Vibrio phage 1.206.O._10N.222.51.B10]|nr:coil containing protein [Vibrio phage 1.206.O._10N.222.51.B10]
MNNLEVYYRGVITILELDRDELKEVAFDIDHQLKDEMHQLADDPQWRRKARFKLRRLNTEVEQYNACIKKYKQKLHISRLVRPGSKITVSHKYAVSLVEHEIAGHILRMKLKDLMGKDEYIEFMQKHIQPMQEVVTRDFNPVGGRMPHAQDLYNWRNLQIGD